MTIPFAGGKKSRSELAAAKHRKRQALLELKSIEVALVNSVDTALQNIHSTREQVHQNAQYRALNQQLLDVELARLEAGKGNSRDVLQKEEGLNRARFAEIESVANHQKALMSFDVAVGTMLLKYGIEEMEDEWWKELYRR